MGVSRCNMLIPLTNIELNFTTISKTMKILRKDGNVILYDNEGKPMFKERTNCDFVYLYNDGKRKGAYIYTNGVSVYLVGPKGDVIFTHNYIDKESPNRMKRLVMLHLLSDGVNFMYRFNEDDTIYTSFDGSIYKTFDKKILDSYEWMIPEVVDVYDPEKVLNVVEGNLTFDGIKSTAYVHIKENLNKHKVNPKR